MLDRAGPPSYLHRMGKKAISVSLRPEAIRSIVGSIRIQAFDPGLRPS
jgi:hypothetical protein